MVEPSSEARKAHCSACGGTRNCDVRGHWPQNGSDGDYDWHTDWYLLQCRGCEHVFAQTVSTNSEDLVDYYDGHEEVREYIETEKYWPALAGRSRPDWLRSSGLEVPDVGRLDTSLLELYAALDNDLNVLAGIGIRTSFDVASELLAVDPSKTFAEKLAALVEKGHIGAVDKGRLAALVDAGSASAHRGWRPSSADLDTMMAVLEHFIEQAFVQPHRRKQLDEKVSMLAVPGRKPRKKLAVVEAVPPEAAEAEVLVLSAPGGE